MEDTTSSPTSIDLPPCSNPGQALCRMASPCSATVTSEGRGPSCCGLFPLPYYTATSWQNKNMCNYVYMYIHHI